MKVILAAVLLLTLICLSCQTKKPGTLSDAELAKLFSKNDKDLGYPKPGEWLYEHKERGQSFDQYKKQDPVRTTPSQNKIYLLPIGKFSKPQEAVIEYTRDYLSIFFQLETIELPVISDDIIPPTSKRVRENGSTQLLSTYILELLKKRIPKDGIALMAITEKDLYPKPEWNFVFGQASFHDKVGVSSIYRYSKETIDSNNYHLCLGRLISTSSHEIGHMFSIRHCTNAVCVMNGSNSLQESDSRPNRLCSECLQKLQWNFSMKIRERTRSLDSFFTKHRLTGDYNVSHEDLKLINDYAR
jgi:archaemetzincin